MTDCACGYERVAVPTTRDEALELAREHTAAMARLETLSVDRGRWLSVLRCPACNGLWMEDSISSGHMDLFFVFPLRSLRL